MTLYLWWAAHSQELVPQDCLPLQMPDASLGSRTSNWSAANQESPWFHLRLSLLEWLTQLRKTLWLHRLVYYEGYNLRTARWNRCIGQGMWGWGWEKVTSFQAIFQSYCQLCSPAQQLIKSGGSRIFINNPFPSLPAMRSVGGAENS